MKTILKLALATTLALSIVGSTRAQVLINWGSPQTITDDSNLAANGTYFDAVNTSQSNFTTTTVGTTQFNQLTYVGTAGTDGAISVDIGGGGTFVPGYSGGSAAYNNIVGHGADFAGGSITLGSVTDPLTIGATYQVEVWDYWNGGPYQASVQGSPTLNFAYPAFQFAIGSFTASATTETFDVTGAPDSNGAGFLNDVVVREIPEPSTDALMLGGTALLVLGLRRRLPALR